MASRISRPPLAARRILVILGLALSSTQPLAKAEPATALTSIQHAKSQDDALAYIRAIARGSVPAKVDPDAATLLVSRSWWTAALELVEASHRAGDAERTKALDSVVRREVGLVKQSADDLLLALSPQESGRIGVVRCAFQWAQNSSAIFFSVKFAHRWTSPGALKVYDESINVSKRCLNFSASGEHSQLHKRYALDLEFFKDVDPTAYSWQFASAGRLTIEIQKAKPGEWSRLLSSKQRPNNMAVWDEMRSKWSAEVKAFKKRAKGGKQTEDDAEDSREEALETHRKLAQKCANNKVSPFWQVEDVKNLCEDYWPPSMQGRLGRATVWLVLFYSARKLGCHEGGDACGTTRARWLAAAESVKLHRSSVASVGAVNCDLHSHFCKQQEIRKAMAVRRFQDGKKRVYKGGWDVDSIMALISA